MQPVTTPPKTGNWLRMHRGMGIEPKKKHRTFLGAWWHLHQHRKHIKVDADLIWMYPCWFTDTNGFGRKHYHIGHLPKGRKMGAAPRPGTLLLGVFAVHDGFEARTFRQKPPLCYPAMPTVGEALEVCTDFP